MKSNKISAFCFGIMALCLAACGGDKFSQVIEIELPEHTPMLSVSAEFSSVDTILVANTSSTWATNDAPADPNVKDASIKIFENGVIWRELAFNPNNGNYEWEGNSNFVADGQTIYRLEVEAPGFETVFAEQKMPTPVEITSLEYKYQGTVGPEGGKVDELNFEFQDPAGEEDYYGLAGFYLVTEVINEDTFVFSYNMYLESYDPLLEGGASNLLLLSDKSFDGKKVSLKTYCYCGFGENGQYRIVGQLVHLTREKYRYLRSLRQYQNADGNPFAEPVTVQGNIENGVGVFSLESMDTVQLRF